VVGPSGAEGGTKGVDARAGAISGVASQTAQAWPLTIARDVSDVISARQLPLLRFGVT
jgi:hypothetical protein